LHQHSYIIQKQNKNKEADYIPIPKPPQDVSFRMAEQIMIKELLFINGCPLKIDATTSMVYSAIPKRLV